LCSYEATAGKRLADVYGNLPGFWMHPSLMVDLFEKNITKWSGEQPHDSVRLRLTTAASGQPTDQLVKVRGVKATKNLKAGAGHSANTIASCCQKFVSI
jgi:hypothetical protein